MFVTLQTQFVMIISHTAYNKFVRSDCDYPYLYNSIVFYYTISMVVLFSHFYYFTYVHRRQPAKATAVSAETTNGLSANGHVTSPSAVLNGGSGDVRSRKS